MTLLEVESNPNVHIVPSLAEPVGKLWLDLQKQHTARGYFNVASPLSSTPLPIYSWLISNSSKFSHWDKVRFLLMDEQVEDDGSHFRYIDSGDSASYEKFAYKQFIGQLKERVELFKPDLQNLKTFGQPIDLLILALGVKGNYANVMPGTPLNTGWHIASLTDEFKKQHTHSSSQSFAGATFREYGMSLGPQQVLQAKNVIVVISGSHKSKLTQQLFNYDEFEPSFPLSIVHHIDVKGRVQFYITPDVIENSNFRPRQK